MDKQEDTGPLEALLAEINRVIEPMNNMRIRVAALECAPDVAKKLEPLLVNGLLPDGKDGIRIKRNSGLSLGSFMAVNWE